MKSISPLNRKIWFVYSILFLLVACTQLTPELAVRTKLFTLGHFKEAVQSNIVSSGADEQNHVQLYKVSPAPLFQDTQVALETYNVRQFLLFYYASYHGEV